MDKKIDQKLETLLKYVPFIDYILNIDKEKYIKFIDIKKWILKKKRYPLSDLNKIEQSIITQYKNIILIVDERIPQEITNIFDDNLKHQYVNLCSDDEDGATIATKVDGDKQNKSLTTSTQGGRGSKKSSKVQSDSEDDIEIVSISYPEKSKNTVLDSKITPKREVARKKSSGSSPPPCDLDDQSAKLLTQIDQISCEEKEKFKNEYVEPHNYHVVLSDEEDEAKDEILFQRRPRRDDSKPPEENKDVNPKTPCSNITSAAEVDTISLDSSDDDETTVKNICDKITKTQANKVELSPKKAKTSGCATQKPNNVKEEAENLTNDHLCRLIESEVKNLDTHQLQALLKQIVSKWPSTESSAASIESSTALIENDLPSPSSKQNDPPSSGSPPPPAPRIEPTGSPEGLLKALYQFLDKVQKTERDAPVGANTIETPRNPVKTSSENYNNQQNMSLFTPNPLQYQHHQPQQQLNFYNNNPGMQISMSHQANILPHPMYPHIFDPYNQQARAPYNPGILQTFTSAKASLNSRDPRARSALYQNSVKIIEAEVAKRNIVTQSENVHQSHVPPVLLPNTSVAAVNQSMEMSSPQQYYRLSTGITQSNVQTCQQLYGKHNEIKNNSVQTTESGRTNTKKATPTYGEYRRRKSEEKHKLEKQREEEKRRQEALLTRIDGVSSGEYEYKRRQVEDQRKAEKLREEEKNREDNRVKDGLTNRQAEALKCKEAEELEKREAQKKRLDLHSILFTALQPYEDKIEKVWNAKKDPVSNEDKLGHKPENKNASKESVIDNDGKQETELNSMEKENAKDICCGKKRKNEVMSDAAKEISSKTGKGKEKCNQPANYNDNSKKSNTEDNSNNCVIKKQSNTSKSNEEKDKINNRINRIFKEMECTLKGYDQLPKSIGGKRRSSLHARTIILEQLSSSQGSEKQDDDVPPTLTNLLAKQFDNLQSKAEEMTSSISSHLAEKGSVIKNSAPPIRRSSIHARSAIATQLNSQSSLDSSDNYTPSADSANSSSSSVHSTNSKKRKGVDALSSNSETNDFEIFRVNKAEKITKTILRRQPSVILRRLTESEIKKHSKIQENPKPYNILNVHLIESGIRPDTTNDISKTSATTTKKSTLKKCNNDCQMTERNTKFCALCSSKPSDLTNHYKRRHKCESYVSRLTWSELDELCISTPFAKLVPSTNSRLDRYAVLCPFCNEKLVEPFMNLYNHYASHTGEYAFQCAACQLDKPFRADIQSHQLHSKTCRNSQIQTMYRYPSNTMSIYLHYCTICNFVQLNEANIFKHLRDHHDPRKSTPENVQKCILTAISDGPESNNNEAPPASSMVKSQIVPSDDTQNKEINEPLSKNENQVIAKAEIDLNLDDNIPVFNEACSEETLELEERLKQMHEEQSCERSAPQEPMTVIHFDCPSSAVGADVGRVLNKAPSRHVPKSFKTEAIDFGEKFLLTPPRPSTVSSKSYTKNISSYSTYRSYPPNVNYLGFYKCMAGDCFYSSDCPEEFEKHVENHQRESLPENHLFCPYCIIPAAACQSVHQLVDHIRTQHAHLLYQCSMCCYRSCEGSNVLIHQKEKHSSNIDACNIYKCSGTEISLDANYIMENMSESVGKIQCPYCLNSFYNTILLMQHISTDHKTDIQEKIERYSCVYCFFWDKDQSVIRKHLALNHPGELPFLCDHNSSTGAEDLLHYLEPKGLSQLVPVTEVSATYDTLPKKIHGQNSIVEDIKPSVEELVRCQSETVKIRLRKLTEKTGVAPDCLYRCPELSCGGFFSIYDLWLRHMRVKHLCLENRCPHCPIQTTKSLEAFKFHFEEHRRHTYICFHCPKTFAISQYAQDHWLRDHNELGLMHVEQIRFNLNYSYYILMQPNKFQNQTQLLTSLCDIFDQRIKDLESNEVTKLKHMWLVPNSLTTLWLEDYPKHFMSPQLVKRCFNGNCNFRTKSDDTLFNHVRANHDINGSIFKCSKCDFRLEKSSCWDDALNHIKQHSETSFFICGACSKYYLCRSKIADHVRSEHAARDVPIVNLLKRGQLLYARIAIVFANERLTFSTLRNCFCCDERNMKGDAFILHLKRYHHFVLNYFCEWCNLPIDSLQSVEKHFRQNHTTNKPKIRCELASKSNLSILSVKEFQIQISCNVGDLIDNSISPIVVKEDPDADDSVIIVEDDDILVENFVKIQKSMEEKAEKPKLKCIATESLLEPSSRDPVVSQNAAQLRILPRIKIVQKRQSSSDSAPIYSKMPCPDKTAQPLALVADQLQYNAIASESDIQPITMTDSVISSQRIILSSSSASKNASNIQPNSNAHIPPSKMMAANQYKPVSTARSTLLLPTSKRPRTNKSANNYPVQSSSAPGVVATSLSLSVSAPPSYYTNSLPQSATEYSNPSRSPFEMQSMHARNLQFAQGSTTSFLNSHHVPTMTTTTAMQNAHPHHIMASATNAHTYPAINYSMSLANVPQEIAKSYNLQNVSHASNVSRSSTNTTPLLSTGYTTVQSLLSKGPASSSHMVGKTSSTKTTVPVSQIYVNSSQRQTPHYAVAQSVVVNTAPSSSSGNTMHPNYNLSVSASISCNKY